MLWWTLRQLKSKDHYKRRSAVEKLGHSRNRRVVEPLVSALKDGDGGVRVRAVAALGKIGDTRAVGPLVMALKDDGDYVREAAAHALRMLRDARAVRPLMALLADKDDRVQKAAAAALEQIGAPESSQALAEYKIQNWLRRAVQIEEDLDAPAPQTETELKRLRRAYNSSNDADMANTLIAQMYKRMGQKEELSSIHQQLNQCIDEMGDAAVEPLLTLLKEGNYRVRLAAAKIVYKIGHPQRLDAQSLLDVIKGSAYRDSELVEEAWDLLDKIGSAAVEALVGALRIEGNRGWEETLRQKAADTLVKIGNSRAVEALVMMLQDQRNLWGISKAAYVLARIADPRSVMPLVEALGHDAGFVRKTAAYALGKIGDARAVEPLTAALKDTDRSVRQAAVHALGDVGDARTVEPLKAALKDEDGEVREAAMEALKQIGGARTIIEALAALLDDQDLRWEIRIKAAGILDSLGWQSSNDSQRALCAIALQKWDEVANLGLVSVEPLMIMLHHGDYRVREKVVKALGNIGDARAAEPLVAMLNDKHVEVAATESLCKIGTAAVEPLLALLKNNDYSMSEKALDILAKIGDERAVKPLLALLSDQGSNRKLRIAAGRALQKMKEGKESHGITKPA